MLSFILAPILGAGFAYLATQNTVVVPLRIGPYVLSHVPLYLVALGSVLLGSLVTWIMSLGGVFTSSIALRSKDREIQQTEDAVREQAKRIKHLENEVNRLAKQQGSKPFTELLRHALTT